MAIQAWGQLLAAVLLAAALYGLHALGAWRRARRREQQMLDLLQTLARQTRKLFYHAAQAFQRNDLRLSVDFLAAIGREGRELRAALQGLALERLPDPGLAAPLLSLRACLGQFDALQEVLTAAEAAALCRRLQRRADAAAQRIVALARLRRGEIRLPLRKRCEAGMPSTAVDRYAVFQFPGEMCLAQDAVDFEVLVNGQSVLCTIAHGELDALAGRRGGIADYASIFRQWRDGIEQAAQQLIRAGMRSPVQVRRAQIGTALPSGGSFIEEAAPP